MRIDHLVLAAAAALACAACASSPKLETASVGAKAAKRPAAEKSAVTKASVAPKQADQDAKADPAARAGFNDSGRASYCARWLEHRASGTLPSHVKPGSPDVAHGDAYCQGYQ